MTGRCSLQFSCLSWSGTSSPDFRFVHQLLPAPERVYPGTILWHLNGCGADARIIMDREATIDDELVAQFKPEVCSCSLFRPEVIQNVQHPAGALRKMTPLHLAPDVQLRPRKDAASVWSGPMRAVLSTRSSAASYKIS